jgi:hypothetical protein
MPLQAEQWTNSALPRGALRSVYLEAQSENRSDVHVAKPEPVGRHAFILHIGLLPSRRRRCWHQRTRSKKPS